MIGRAPKTKIMIWRIIECKKIFHSHKKRRVYMLSNLNTENVNTKVKGKASANGLQTNDIRMFALVSTFWRQLLALTMLLSFRILKNRETSFLDRS